MLRAFFIEGNMKKKSIIATVACACVFTAAAVTAAAVLYYKDRSTETEGMPDDSVVIAECEEKLGAEGIEPKEGISKENKTANEYLEQAYDEYTFRISLTETQKAIRNVNFSSVLQSSGFQVDENGDGYLKVAVVAEDSPAERQGLREGDVILTVDGDNVKRLGIERATELLMGKDGSTMKLKIKRDGKKMKLDFVRSNDPERTSSFEYKKLDGGIDYINITSFMDGFTHLKLNEKIPEITDSDKIIIDIRDNEGGYINEMLLCADDFIGDAVVNEFYYSGKTETLKTSDSESDLCAEGVKTVVLVNSETASAAEAFTALLKQYGGDVTLLGENTFGKCIFQDETPLECGGTLHYTTGYWTVGDWESFQGKGIAPDIEVKMDRSLIGTDNDTQLQAALELFD